MGVKAITLENATSVAWSLRIKESYELNKVLTFFIKKMLYLIKITDFKPTFINYTYFIYCFFLILDLTYPSL